MNKTVMSLVAVAITLSGCASMQAKWKRVQPGQTQAQMEALLGPPDSFTQDQGKNILSWNIDEFTKCGVLLDSDMKAEAKTCKVDEAAKARHEAARAQAAMMYFQMQGAAPPRMPAYQMPIYQQARPVQTNCTTNMSGNTAYSNCSSQPTGVDTSIYR